MEVPVNHERQRRTDGENGNIPIRIFRPNNNGEGFFRKIHRTIDDFIFTLTQGIKGLVKLIIFILVGYIGLKIILLFLIGVYDRF